MTWLVIGIALALPAIFYILLVNLGNFGGDWDGNSRVSLYLEMGTTEEEGVKLLGVLQQLPGISAARYISASSALAEFEESAGFQDVLASLPANPLPAVIEIEPEMLSAAEIKLMVAGLEARPEIESSSIDIEWIERLLALLALGERFVTALAFFLGLGVLLAIGNTVRLTIENRRSEIEVIKLVGGTDRFVRRPFLYLGFWYGLGGAIVAWIMVQASLEFLAVPLERLIHSYHDEFTVAGFGLAETLILLTIGAFLGVSGAAFAVGRHLKRIEPG